MPSDRDDRARREQQAAISRAAAAKGREIGSVPDIVDPDRRASCRTDLKLFCETYNPAAFNKGWSGDHLKVIARIQEAVLLGALYALAMARGSGKSTLCRMAVLWALSYAHRRYPFLVGANADKGRDGLEAIKTYIRFLPEYGQDFPELAIPAVAIGGIAQRAGGQTCGGESTMVEWGKDRIILATVRPPANWPKGWPLRPDGMVPTAGAVVGASGLTGEGIRGSNMTRTTGEAVRPDLVVLDDPQTDESARSRTQNESRERLISGAVLGMAGPGEQIAAVMPCTVIAPGDMVDRVLDRTKHPLWRGERTAMLRSMPVNLGAWREYFETYYRCALKEPPDFAEANAEYLANRAALDAGAEASWEDRKADGDVSAIQHAMHIFARDERAFWSEYQNQPLADLVAGQKELDAAALAERLSGVPRGEVPRECTRVTAFVDCAQRVLWYALVAWDERFGGAVIDYGAWPEQRRSYWTQADSNPTLADRYPGLPEPSLVYAGLKDLTAWILDRRYRRHETGEELAVELLLGDSGWQTDAVFKFCRESRHSALILPSKGFAAGTTSKPVDEWPHRPGERVGSGWRLGPDATPGRGRRVAMDVDKWKTFVADRLLTPAGSPGALMLFGADGTDHRMICDHLTAEYARPVTARGRTWDKWQERADKPDNHLWDCVVGCAVAAGVRGLVWSPNGGPPPAPKVRRKVKYSEVLARKDREQGYTR